MILTARFRAEWDVHRHVHPDRRSGDHGADAILRGSDGIAALDDLIAFSRLPDPDNSSR
jgi:hypothetical protein